MSGSATTATAPYRCLCRNSIDGPNAKFRAFGSDGTKGKEVIVRSLTSEHLTLPDASNNIVKVEYYDVPYQNDGCYSPVNSGDEVKIVGISNDFQVTINGSPGQQVTCPNE